MATIGIDGAGARAPRAGEGRLVDIVAVAEAGEGVCGVVGFGVIPVAAVVGVGGGEGVILRRGCIGMECLCSGGAFGWQVILPGKERA